MGEVLKVDIAELRYQVQQAGETLHQLQDHAKSVGQITDSFDSALKGETGDAVREALGSFSKAMAALCIAHQGITEKLQEVIASYDGIDTHAAEVLTDAMKL